MLDYAKFEFELDKKPKGSEATQRQHLQAIQDNTGITLAELDRSPPHGLVAYLLDYFYELSLSRQSGMGLSPILYAEIVAWCQLTHTCLARWELETIKRLDLLWLSVNAE
ncbi:MAG: hypothetical protein SOX56_07345 [[Pasteurella] mairii]|uniref:Uncharacterized protein n=1 Tax=[Pasteurella] mairii TaxID=757 RepID=A0A379B5G8_9PAST|nr:hypothetical protein [[Pasteurella] mairii]SUB33300.1 Uncharacterised protein [[Pasteurella] mairii]